MTVARLSPALAETLVSVYTPPDHADVAVGWLHADGRIGWWARVRPEHLETLAVEMTLERGCGIDVCDYRPLSMERVSRLVTIALASQASERRAGRRTPKLPWMPD